MKFIGLKCFVLYVKLNSITRLVSTVAVHLSVLAKDNI